MPPQQPILNSPDAQVAPLLKAHEQQLTAQVPSFLKPVMPESPSKIFGDYIKTGAEQLKTQAGDALNSLSSFVSNIPKTVLGESTYNAPSDVLNPINDTLLDRIKQNEGAQPNAIVHNRDKFGHITSTDYGQYQINSLNLPMVKKAFQQQGKSFDFTNPEHSREAAKIVLQDNYNNFEKKVGRPPNQAELESSYNVGWPVAAQQALTKAQGPAADNYVKASIFHG